MAKRSQGNPGARTPNSGQPPQSPSGVPTRDEGGAIDDSQAEALKAGTPRRQTKQELEQIKILTHLRNATEKQRVLLAGWETQSNNDLKLKRYYAICILSGLAVELVLGNIAMFFIGFDMFNIPEWVANTFFVGMYVQIITLVTIIVKHLFPSKTDSLTQLNELLKEDKPL